MALSIFFICSVLFAAPALLHADEVGEYGRHSKFRKALCEKNDHEMLKEINECFQMADEEVQKASKDCAKEAHPESEEDLVEFVVAACGEKEIFMKFDECFEKHESDPEFKAKLKINPEKAISKNMELSGFLLCTMLLGVSAQHIHLDVGEYGYYNTWRKAVCEKSDQDMYKEMEVCFLMEQKVVLDATNECAKEAFPESKGETIPFINEACKDKTIFKKFDECFEEYEKNAAFRKQMAITPEMEDCYGKIFDKYGLSEFKKYLKDYVDS